MGPKKAASSKNPSKPRQKPPFPPTIANNDAHTTIAPTPSEANISQAPSPTLPSPKPFIFKGHPQPPVDERLFAAKNFLADEDSNRCLEFATKIAQVEEFVAQIEKDNVPCDAGLFRDVKVKLKVHRDWEERVKASAFDTGCCEAPLIAPFSTRLISAETAANLRRERESQGLFTQMRSDHAPFTINSEEDDHAAFLAKLREDASANPDTINHDTNLLWTESRAYQCALQDPALIPHSIHSTKAVPTTGESGADAGKMPEDPISDRVRVRPTRGWVPDYVIATEERINELLKKQPPSAEEFAELEELLRPFEPPELRELHEQEKSPGESHPQSRYSTIKSAWLSNLAADGVYFLMSNPRGAEVQLPGVFYIDDGILTQDRQEILATGQQLLDKLLSNGRAGLDAAESASLISLLQYSLPEEIRKVQEKLRRILETAGVNSILDLGNETQGRALELEREQEKRIWDWLDEMKRMDGAEFRYLRPAEMKSHREDIIYLPWSLTAIPNMLPSTEAKAVRKPKGGASRSPPALMAPPTYMELENVEIEIDNLLGLERDNIISEAEQEKLDYLLGAVLPPRLGYLRDQLERRVAQSPEMSPSPFKKWKLCFLGIGIILDHWFCKPEALAEVWSRSRIWKERTANVDGSSKLERISDEIEDPAIEVRRAVYKHLRKWVEAGCPHYPGIDIERKVLLPHLPEKLVDQTKYIRDQEFGRNQKDKQTDKATQTRLLHSMKEQFIKSYVRWLISLTPSQIQRFRDPAGSSLAAEMSLSSKAERRGVQRAAIELALNLFATNQEQHRPNDCFRMLELPQSIQLPEKEVPLCLPLRPEERPLEQDPFEYTRRLFAFRWSKDDIYEQARHRANRDRGGMLPAQENHNGPASIATSRDVQEAARRQLKNLASIKAALIEAEKSAPRPLIERLLLLVSAGLEDNSTSHPLYDNEKLTEQDLNLLESISGRSWDEERREYGEVVPGLLNIPEERGRLHDFELDIAQTTELPLWQPAADLEQSVDRDDEVSLAQLQHSPIVPSVASMPVNELRQIICNRRLEKAKGGFNAGSPQIWEPEEVTRYLKAMASAGRIHLDQSPNGTILVSRIPLSGHPENKYVTSRESAISSPGVRIDAEGRPEVRYDTFGNYGPPIVQPNKFYHLQCLAFRVGRDLQQNLRIIGGLDPEIPSRAHEQLEGTAAAEAKMQELLSRNSGNTTIPTLQSMVQNLHQIAPDLAQEAGIHIPNPREITERQSAQLLQMQILEEASNNWEFKFPEKEHVWDFAEDRLQEITRNVNGRQRRVKPRQAQFFSMRRYPPCCQSTATKTKIQESGPSVQEKPQMKAQHMVVEAADGPPQKTVRHIKGREPFFSLGESQFERAYLSWRMEQELADVEGFKPEPRRRRWFDIFKSRREDDQGKTEPYPLPKLPSDWVPDNISVADKRALVLTEAKRTPGFPNPAIDEYYHTPQELILIKQQREWDQYVALAKRAQAAIVKHTGKPLASLTQDELWAAEEALNINHQTKVFMGQEAKKGTAGRPENLGPRGAGRTRRTRPRSVDQPMPMMSGAIPAER